MRLDLLLVTTHVASNLVWIGSLLGVVVVVSGQGADPKTRGQLALAVFRSLSVPAFVASLLLGAIRLGLDWHHYMVATHFMHAKLALALLVIVAHHWIGARVKATIQSGDVRHGSLRAGAALFALASLLIVWLAVSKPF